MEQLPEDQRREMFPWLQPSLQEFGQQREKAFPNKGGNCKAWRDCLLQYISRWCWELQSSHFPLCYCSKRFKVVLQACRLELPWHNSYTIWKQLNQSRKDQLAYRIDLIKDTALFHSFGTLSCCPGPSQSSTIQTNVMRLTEKQFISKIPLHGGRKERRYHSCNLIGQHK